MKELFRDNVFRLIFIATVAFCVGLAIAFTASRDTIDMSKCGHYTIAQYASGDVPQYCESAE